MMSARTPLSCSICSRCDESLRLTASAAAAVASTLAVSSSTRDSMVATLLRISLTVSVATMNLE